MPTVASLPCKSPFTSRQTFLSKALPFSAIAVGSFDFAQDDNVEKLRRQQSCLGLLLITPPLLPSSKKCDKLSIEKDTVGKQRVLPLNQKMFAWLAKEYLMKRFSWTQAAVCVFAISTKCIS